MRTIILTLTLGLLLAAMAAPVAEIAQDRAAETSLSHAAVVVDGGMRSPHGAPSDAVPNDLAVRAPFQERSRLLLPSVGAGVGAVGATVWVLHQCSREDCIVHPVAPAAIGGALGAAMGLALDLLLRLVGIKGRRSLRI